MFTGIIQDIGSIAAIARKGDWVVTIKTGLPLAKTKIGASVSCSGACLTVIAKTAHAFKVQVSAETLAKTTIKHWKIGTRVNLEPALRMGDELGGHLVTGHVDNVARVKSRMQDGDSLRLQFATPPELARFLAPKGAIVIDGVSLTINGINDMLFWVNVIPHTQKATTLGTLKIGDKVNLEVDMIARYLDRLIER